MPKLDPDDHDTGSNLPSPKRGTYARGKDPYAAEVRLLMDLMGQQREYAATNLGAAQYLGYLECHMAAMPIRRELANLDLIQPFIRGRVLEWGCAYARDSCIYRTRLGDSVELYGADTHKADTFKPFHDYCGIRYQQVQHPYRLEYADAFFDTVTSTGVLEHVPDALNSVREIHRVLKPGGHFVITFLPNHYSYTEAFQRFRKFGGHERLYTMEQGRRMLTEHGYEVVDSWYFLVLPTMLTGFPARLKAAWDRNTDTLWRLNTVLERLWPINRIASNLSLIARKPG